MLIDHFGLMFYPNIVAFRAIGRLAMPIFAYCIGGGVLKTRNKLKYFLRVFILGVICQLFYIGDELVTNHEINDYQRTRGILTNCNYVVLFPFYSLATQMNLVMDKIGISKATQKKILDYKGRAVIIRKIAPMYCVMNRKVFLLRK